MEWLTAPSAFDQKANLTLFRIVHLVKQRYVRLFYATSV